MCRVPAKRAGTNDRPEWGSTIPELKAPAMRIGYVRVSTSEQSVDRQIEILTGEGVEEEYIFKDVESGRKTDRDGLEEALDELREGDKLVVAELDRLGRSLRDHVNRMNEIDEKDAYFRAVKEGVDTETAQGEIVALVYALLAEIRARYIRERTKEGLEQAKKQGRGPGRERKIQPEDMPLLETLIQDPNVQTKHIMGRFGIESKSTLFSYIGPDGEWRRYEDQKADVRGGPA